MPTCPSCGADVAVDDDYCGDCGAALATEGPQSVAEKHFAYEVRSLGHGAELLAVNVPIVFGLIVLLQLLPHRLVWRLGELGQFGVILGGTLLANLFLYLRYWRHDEHVIFG